jgi:hypothetical protein
MGNGNSARIVVAVALALGSGVARAEGPTPSGEARALFDRWLEVQSGGDFAAYQGLYAAAFIGVRRSGPRIVTLDRAGWMKDRARMFAKPMTVTATRVLVFASPRAARIVFTQDWASGTYHDVGTKQLVLRHGPDGFRIQREELFSSRAPGTFDAATFARHAFVIDGAAVVLPNPPDDWAGGAVRPTTYGKELIARASRPVALAKLPPAVRELVGKMVALGNATGQRCTAKLTRLELRARVLIGTDPEGDDIWNMGSKALVAVLAGEPACVRSSTWARAADQPPLPIAAAAAPDAALKGRALVAFAALPAAAEIQRRFATWFTGEQGARKRVPAWVRSRETKTEVRLLQLGAGPRFVSVSAVLNAGGCSDGVFESLWSLWEIDESDRLVPRSEPTGMIALSPAALADLDGDGKPEILFDDFSNLGNMNAAGQPETMDRGVVRARDGLYVDVEGLGIPDLICPC